MGKFGIILFFCVLLLTLPSQRTTAVFSPAAVAAPDLSAVLGLIVQQKYDDALNRLEELEVRHPQDPEILTLQATARMYRDRDFLRAQKDFETALAKGGGATFLLNHSHEITKMATDEMADYCRGWLHLRRDGLRFVPLEEGHRLQLAYAQVVEIKQNANRKLFHLKLEKDNYNFLPRSRHEMEALLAIVMFKKVAGVK